MEIGFEVVAAKPKRSRDDADAPTQQPMRAGKSTLRNPSTDQKKVRRQIQRSQKSAAAEENPMSQHVEADLLARMAAATSLSEQRRLAAQLEAHRAQRTAAAREASALDLAAASTFETGVPVHQATQWTQHTAATDWLGEVSEPTLGAPEIERRMRAEASVWYSGRPDFVKADDEELTAQAIGFARRQATQFGPHSEAAQLAFLEQVAHLARTAGQRVAYDAVQPGPYQAENGSSLPVGVDNDDTFDQSIFTPAGGEDPETDKGDSPSLAEGDQPEGDSSETVENEAASNTHNEGGGNGPATDYLDGTQTAYPGKQSSRKVAEDQKSDDGNFDTPSYDEGGPIEGDHSEPPVEEQSRTTYDAGPGESAAIDYLDGEQYAFPKGASVAQVAAQIQEDRVPQEARVYLAALRRMSTLDDTVGGIPGRQILALFLKHAMQATALRGHRHVASLAALAEGRVQAAEYKGGSPKEGDTAVCHKDGGAIQFFAGEWMHLKGTGDSHNDVYPATPKEKAEKEGARKTASRPVYEIASEIEREWGHGKVNYAAKPYLDAMKTLTNVSDMYYQDPGAHIVRYFLSNASSFRGEKAKALKDELKNLLKTGSVKQASGQYKVQVAGVGEGVWSQNALTFDTEEEARAYASDLMGRWMGADLARVVPADTPNREPVDPSDPAIVINYRTASRRTAATPPNSGDMRSLHVQRKHKEYVQEHGEEPSREQVEEWRAEAERLWKKKSKTAADGATCATCGDPIERDPAGETNRTWHHSNGEKHDHEAKPSGGETKESSLQVDEANRFFAALRSNLG